MQNLPFKPNIHIFIHKHSSSPRCINSAVEKTYYKPRINQASKIVNPASGATLVSFVTHDIVTLMKRKHWQNRDTTIHSIFKWQILI
jgi:hypothetical protein